MKEITRVVTLQVTDAMKVGDAEVETRVQNMKNNTDALAQWAKARLGVDDVVVKGYKVFVMEVADDN